MANGAMEDNHQKKNFLKRYKKLKIKSQIKQKIGKCNGEIKKYEIKIMEE